MGQQTYDVHADITARIVAAIERGAGTLHVPWRDGTAMQPPINATTNNAYRGINVLSLWLTTQERGYASCEWATFKQWQSRGAMVRKGEKGTPSSSTRRSNAKAPKERMPTTSEPSRSRGRVGCSARARSMATRPNAPLLHPRRSSTDCNRPSPPSRRQTRQSPTGAPRAFYQRTEDRTQVPTAEDFTGTPTSTAREVFYSTVFHELAHWSGAEKRLNREKGKRFADRAYAFEEIIAELSAAFTCARLGISDTPRADHAQYIEQYLAILRNDKKAIFAAATAAASATDYILAFSGPREEPAD